MKRPSLILAGISLFIFLACGGTGGEGSVVSPPPPAPPATNTPAFENPQSYLDMDLAPGYTSVPPVVDCSNIQWELILINKNPSGNPVGIAQWQTFAGAADQNGQMPTLENPPLEPPAPNITVSPASGTLAPGAQVVVRISGSYTTGQNFGVQFYDPHASIGFILSFTCAQS
jgi:hypothetical protein